MPSGAAGTSGSREGGQASWRGLGHSGLFLGLGVPGYLTDTQRCVNS